VADQANNVQEKIKKTTVEKPWFINLLVVYCYGTAEFLSG